MIWLTLIGIASCFAQTSPLAGFAGLGPTIPTVTYDGRYTDGHRPGPSVLENKLSLTLPAYRTDAYSVAPSLTAGQLRFERPLATTAGRPIPRELTRLEVGAQVARYLSGGRNWGVRATVGYAGDRPFAAGEDLSYGLAATYGYPGAKGYWVLMVLLSNNGVLPNYVPIPGFLYVYRTPTFTGVFGLPILSLTWTPTATWSTSLSAFGPLARAEVAYGPKTVAQAFFNYAFTQQVFIEDHRERNRDRLRLQ